jgi:succinate dehydrogenase / fumarate reductase cytochrome b subunit
MSVTRLAPLQTPRIELIGSGAHLRMHSPFRRLFASTVGTKLLIGLTGLGLFVYMLLHLAGNALIFAGQDVFNAYSHTLISNPLIIPIEIGLLLIFILHIYKAIVNYFRNSAARPIDYRKKEYAGHTSRKSLSSSTMIFSGLILLIFVVIHVKQFKFGSYYQTVASEEVRDLYRTEIEVFSDPLWVFVYVLGTAAVGLHLRHGIASGFQSIGFDHPVYARRLMVLSSVLAIAIGGGLAFITIWVYAFR